METYGDAVWRACLLYLPAHEAEDVFQESFLKYALHDAEFKDEGHKKAWLLRVAMNACKDVLKSARASTASLDERVEERGDAALPAGDDEPAEHLLLQEVLDAMDALGDPPKTQLYLALYEGYSVPEIARICDMPKGTVYSWISRGKKRLREVLQ